MGPALEGGVGIPDGRILLEFAAAAHRDDPDLPAARRAGPRRGRIRWPARRVPDGGRVQRAHTVADATGIPLDGGTLAATTDVRAELGLNDMAGALSSGGAVHMSGPVELPASVRDLFAD